MGYQLRGYGVSARSLFLVGVVSLSGTGSASAQTFQSSGVRMLSRVAVVDLPGGSSAANDIWGYVSPGGKEYAIVGLRKGTAFVDISDPAAPIVLPARYVSSGVDETWRDMRTLGPYAYVVNDGATGPGLQVISLANIDAGSVSQVIATRLNGGLFTAHNIAVNTASQYAYLVSSSISPGITAVNLANPTSPAQSAVWGGATVHDVLVTTYTTGPYAGREIAFAFAAHQGLIILDVTDKANIFERGRLAYPNVTYCHQGWLTDDRRYLLINDELDEIQNPNVNSTTTYVVDVQDLSQPQFVRSFTNGLSSIDHNLMVRGSLVYEANYTSGLRVWDVSDVRRPVEIAWFDTYPNNDSRSFNGAWGVYAHLPSGNIIVSDISYGLFVLRVDCNENGIDDDVDVAVGSSLDVNGNGIPDECDGFVDCNGNGVSDRFDLSEGTSVDCNENAIPDECELAAQTGTDCNSNGLLDECEIVVDYSAASPPLTPIGFGLPQGFLVADPPPAVGDVRLSFLGYGDFSGAIENVVVKINGTTVGTVFAYMSLGDCRIPPDTDELVVPAAAFRALVGTGSAMIDMVPDASVSGASCGGNSYIQVTLSYRALDAMRDCNGTLMPDECEIGDADGDTLITLLDGALFADCVAGPCSAAECDTPFYTNSCCILADFDGDGDVDLADIAALQRRIYTLAGS